MQLYLLCIAIDILTKSISPHNKWTARNDYDDAENMLIEQVEAHFLFACFHATHP